MCPGREKSQCAHWCLCKSVLLNFSAGSFECQISFLRLENLVFMTTERCACLSSAVFVYCNDRGGVQDASQRGCRSRKCSFFSPGFCWAGRVKASHVACVYFSPLFGLCAAEAPSSLPDESWACIVPQWPQGRCWASFPRGPPGAVLTSAEDKVDAASCAMITWHVEWAGELIEDIRLQEVHIRWVTMYALGDQYCGCDFDCCHWQLSPMSADRGKERPLKECKNIPFKDHSLESNKGHQHTKTWIYVAMFFSYLHGSANVCSGLSQLWRQQSIQPVTICLALGFSGFEKRAHSWTTSDYDVNRLASSSLHLSQSHTHPL